MRWTTARRHALLLALLLLGACGGEGKVLVGQWHSREPGQEPQRFTFERGGKARWELGSGDRAQVFDLRYRLSTRSQPWTLDLTGFESGPMAGSKMLCVVEMPSPYQLDLDCWPADPKNKNAPRPKKLGPGAVRLKRVPP